MKIKALSMMAKALSTNARKAANVIAKNEPAIALVIGGVAIAGGVIAACRGTLKAQKHLEEVKQSLNVIHEAKTNPDTKDKYTPEEEKNDLTATYLKLGAGLLESYLPAAVCLAFGGVSIFTSYRIMKARNIALAATCNSVLKQFRQYRNNVIAEYGEETDIKFKNGVTATTLTKRTTAENSTEIVTKETVMTANPSETFGRWFKRGCPSWEPNLGANLMYLRAQERYLNDKLRVKGYMFLNDVYEFLGYERTEYGQTVGWIYDPEHPNNHRDDYITFRLNNYMCINDNDEWGEADPDIFIDFNVDGMILDKFELVRKRRKK